jgi:orotate phosphoribosyltransferase
MTEPGTDIARMLIEIGAVGFYPQEPRRFTSGLLSPMYIDNRRLPFHPEAWRQVIVGFSLLMEDQGITAEVIAGIETAAIPHSAALAFYLSLPSVFVRKQVKEHGAKQRIEGGDVSGKSVLLIEDHITTGGSSLAGIKALREAGAAVKQAVAITSYGFPEAAHDFNAAGVTLHVLASLPAILHAAHRMGRFDRAALDIIEDWASDPHGWAARQGFEESA